MSEGFKVRARAVVLAAGQGKRMKSSRPKVLHEVLGKAIISRILEALDGLDLEHIHIVVGHESEAVSEYLKNNSPRTPFSLHLQKPQLGTGHALMQVTSELVDFYGTLLVAPGDMPLITTPTLKLLIDRHRNQTSNISILTMVVDDPKNYGRIVRDVEGQIIQIVEDKDASVKQKEIKEVNSAVYCLEWPAVAPGLSGLSNNNQQAEYYLTDLVGWAFTNKLPMSSACAPDWREVAGINSRVELSEAERLMRDQCISRLMLDSGVSVVDPQNTWLSPEVRIGAETVVLPGCYLVGDINIGKDCVIGPNTVMQGHVEIGDRTSVLQSHIVNSSIGNDVKVGPFAHMREEAKAQDHSRIGNFVEIKKSSVGNHSNVSHLSYVGDATIGSNANIGAGTITANYDHIKKKKERTIIGDSVSTGSNSVLVAPVKIGNNASVAAGTVVTRDVPDDALAVGRVRQENREGWAAAKRKVLT